METKTEKQKEVSHLLEILDDVESKLNALNHKKYELESRRKYLLEKINKLDEERIVADVAIRVA